MMSTEDCPKLAPPCTEALCHNTAKLRVGVCQSLRQSLRHIVPCDSFQPYGQTPVGRHSKIKGMVDFLNESYVMQRHIFSARQTDANCLTGTESQA